MLFKIVNKIRSLFLFFLNSEKEWRLPKKSDLLFYDFVGYEAFESYIRTYDPTVLYIRGEKFNVPVFLSALLKGRPGLQGYINEFIRSVKPKLILTYIDNNPKFYELKETHPTIVTMFVQNGFRGEIGDIFGYLTPKETYNVDYMLTLGADIGEKYSQYIKGKSISIGSFKNNKIPKGKSIDSSKIDSILFISQYIKRPQNKTEPFYVEADGSVYYWEQFYETELLLLPFLKTYCLEKGLSIKVCGRTKKNDPDEFDFYKNYFEGLDWAMTPHDSFHSSYELIDSAPITVFVDSTLGYEALARGKRSVGITSRCRSLKNESYRFGWPGKLSDNGPFWTNDLDLKSVRRALDHVIEISEDSWQKELKESGFSRSVDFDPDNSRFRDLLSEILVKNNNLN
ncbi:hypothetical protein EHQ76_13780 [Leptospira barantonii]|uniref:Glycosyltransferase family 1 protein n=1 Tax=Leptospira barantonii TaxID=2023184 RepID=A0A5F2B1I8_9LEPT|nr:LA_1612 family putative O-antigen biosynthesis protein [Leptospira barantonii]TGL98096.1 hypothetical protein EHQ76_13780 [Leptospira barantonii]